MPANSQFEAMAKMRRSYQLFSLEMNEFVAASVEGEREAMDRSRRFTHDYLDAYFDAVAAAHNMARIGVK